MQIIEKHKKHFAASASVKGYHDLFIYSTTEKLMTQIFSEGIPLGGPTHQVHGKSEGGPFTQTKLVWFFIHAATREDAMKVLT